MKKQRIDLLLVQRGLCESREQARRLVMAGAVLVDDRPVSKAGTLVREEAVIRVKEKPRYVSRGGYKLEAALQAFNIRPQGWVCADIGASTGGFTDCLLQHGAAKVYAIDVGYGQIHWRLRQDERVIVLERTNARYLQSLPEPIQLTTIDASFISLRHLLPVAARLLAEDGQIIALVKPQFEAGRQQVGKGGVIRDSRIHRQVLWEIITWAQERELGTVGLVPSPLLGPKGNREFLLWLRPGREGLPMEHLLEQ